MDREPARLANHIKRTFTGPMWHGPALVQVLADVTHEQAAAHPIAGAHSIWEIVLHLAAWAEIAKARLHGDRMADPPPEEDWPPVANTGAADWKAATDRLHAGYLELARDVRKLDDAAIGATLAGLEYTASNMLHGVIEHGTYHAGQIVLLAKK